MARKTTFINALALGDEVAEVFLLAEAQQLQARNGPYWRLEFRDSGGIIGGKIWHPQSLAFPDLTPGRMVFVQARVSRYRDRLELSIDSLRPLAEEETAALDLADFLPASPHNPAAMLEELRLLGESVLVHAPWKALLASLLEDENLRSGLLSAPAAKSLHHAYAGGLLEHTLSVTRLCMALADLYAGLDRQILFLGAVCHDLGKIRELSSGLNADYTQAGRLIGHICLGLDMLAPHLDASGLEEPLREHLRHIILSHHGLREFGSPVLPATAEALMLHYADNIDAKLHQMDAALAGLPPEVSGWSPFAPGLDRFLFRPVHTPQERAAPSPPGSPAAAAARQTPAAPATPPRESASLAARPQPLTLLGSCSSPLKG
ncbi:MAG: HD domain-containing protein [Desulfovibrio sp.]|jgi:3'-5' exoribonuclease|nr:HD domain-containing protein [Desulfovibrio sp.]